MKKIMEAVIASYSLYVEAIERISKNKRTQFQLQNEKKEMFHRSKVIPFVSREETYRNHSNKRRRK
ncbi:hypothetical protein [Bacillus timonensis]|uniref:hypothetical protein n=1 Tax=Bacillus timonensis TaxID=1033734 RepID=UPI000288D4EE|nr:hypothetical protein [Bacillus timonensis]